MRLAGKASALTAAAFWVSMILAAQQPADLVGTWSGEAMLKDVDEPPNTLTLALDIKEGKLSGHMTDEYESVDSDISNIVLEQGALYFSVPVLLGQGDQGTILFKMKVSGNAMQGEIEIPEMNVKGTWQATKQK